MKKYHICIIILILNFIGCRQYEVSGGCFMLVENNQIFYNNRKGDLYSLSLNDKSKEKVIDNFYIKAYNEKYFVAYNEDVIKIYNREDKSLKEIKNINLNSLDVFEDKIYYSNINDNNYIYVINIDNMKNELLLQKSTEKLAVNSNYIFYEKEGNFIYKYDLLYGNDEELFEGRWCYFFYCDDKNVYLSNYLDNNTIYKIDINSKKTEKLYDKSAVEFFVYNKKLLYYIPSVNEYDYHENIPYHIYEYNNITGTDKIVV